MAVKACELSKWTNWEIIELASMAQAEFGAFGLAIELQEKAMKLASYPAWEKEKGEKLIEYYQAEKKPWK